MQIFLRRPTFTRTKFSCQTGKVFIIIDDISDISYELATRLYWAGGTVYIAGQSEVNARAAISKIESSVQASSHSTGRLDFLHLDLSDLSSIKATVKTFEAKESKLDVLWNNAGVGKRTGHGHTLRLHHYPL